MDETTDLKMNLTPTFNRAANPPAPSAPVPVPEQPTLGPSPGIASNVQIADLYERLSRPEPQLTLEPMGPAADAVKRKHDESILNKIADMKARLARRRNQARDDFNRAHDGPKGRHLRP